MDKASDKTINKKHALAMNLKMSVMKVIKKDHHHVLSIGVFLYLMTRYKKKFLTKKEQQIKMSSVMSFAFNAVELCVVTINEKPWTRAREVRRALEYNKKTADIVRAFCSQENYAQSIK